MDGIARSAVIIRGNYRDLYSLLTQLRCLNDFLSDDSVVEKFPNLTGYSCRLNCLRVKCFDVFHRSLF